LYDKEIVGAPIIIALENNKLDLIGLFLKSYPKKKSPFSHRVMSAFLFICIHRFREKRAYYLDILGILTQKSGESYINEAKDGLLPIVEAIKSEDRKLVELILILKPNIEELDKQGIVALKQATTL
jgi:hypothetical protein